MIRLVAIVLVAISFQVWSQAVRTDQKATIRLSGISLARALEVISASYGVEFSYSDDVVPVETIVDLSIENQNVESALNTLLSPFKIAFKWSGRNRIILRRSEISPTQNLRGRVTDRVTATGLEGAVVTAISGTKEFTCITNSSGDFIVKNVPVGRINVNVTNVGYETFVVPGVLIDTGKEMVLNVDLSESVTAMHEVEVTALRNDGIAGDGVAVTGGHSFSIEDTKRYAGSLGDPARMVSIYAGVTGASDENNALVVRGNSPRGVLWRLDGIEVPNPNHFTSEGSSGGVVSVLSANMLDRSEFLTGAFPAQYGNVLSAAFDLHLRNGNDQKREYSLQTGLLGIEASAEGPFSAKTSGSYLVNYRYSTLSVLDKLGFELNEAGQYKDYQDLAFKIHKPLGEGSTLSLFGIGGKSKSNKANKNLFDINQSDIGVIALSSRHLIRGHTVVNSALSFSGTAISRSSETTSQINNDSLALKENYTKSFVRAQLSVRRKISSRYYLEGGVIASRLNYDFYLRNVDPNNQAYQVIVNFREKDHTYVTQSFLYARQYFSQSVFGFYGMHYLHFGLTDDYALEPRAGLRWQVSTSDALSVAYGKHSRVENLQYYLGRDHRPGGNEIQINRNLGFTRADHFNVSYERIISPPWRFIGEIYFQQLYNAPVHADPASMYTTINEDTGFITDSLINKGKGRNYGMELSIERAFDNNWYGIVNASLYESTFDIGEARQRNTVYNGNVSIHLAGGKEFEMTGQSRLGVNIKMTGAGGKRYVPIDLDQSIAAGRAIYQWEHAFEHRLPDYYRADLQVVYQVNRNRHAFEYRLDVQNITGHRNAAYYFYDHQSQLVRLRKQHGIIPLLTFRITF
jgi:hypothetical protein